MANIGSLEINSTFQKFEDLLLNQLNHTFDINAEYTLQIQSFSPVQVFEGDTPTENGSFLMKDNEIALYQFTTKNLWLKTNSSVYSNIVVSDNK